MLTKVRATISMCLVSLLSPTQGIEGLFGHIIIKYLIDNPKKDKEIRKINAKY